MFIDLIKPKLKQMKTQIKSMSHFLVTLASLYFVMLMLKPKIKQLAFVRYTPQLFLFSQITP
jgi:hypothetical protein